MKAPVRPLADFERIRRAANLQTLEKDWAIYEHLIGKCIVRGSSKKLTLEWQHFEKRLPLHSNIWLCTCHAKLDENGKTMFDLVKFEKIEPKGVFRK